MDGNQSNTAGHDPRRNLARLWVSAQPAISAYIWSCVQDFHTAEDLLQEVAEDVASSFHRYDPAKPFIGWALGIARFKVIDYYRKNDSDRHVFQADSLDQLTTAFEDIFPDINPKREALEQCLEMLQGKSRKALEMRYEQDMKPAAIAQAIGTSSGSVRVMLTRIRTALGNCIKTRLKKAEGGHA
ncbi:MAG: sigma-70 family RNA polymerase sigma factor [Phycisphaeraceae bacterium]|nr:sigma-70 family RNA polymerase sigma factor [Phycisphaeraceae bacterium]